MNAEPLHSPMDVSRDYKLLLQRLRSLAVASGKRTRSITEISVNGRVYPIVKIRLCMGSRKKRRALISAGIHGDEPAGVEAICAFLERNEFQRYARDWEVTLLPCLNPFGYEHATRDNHEGKDLNRLFKSASTPPEVTAIREVLNRPFDLTLELHEDSESLGFYLYQKETGAANPALGRRILAEAEKTMSININSEIEGMPANRGLINRFSHPEKMKWWPMAIYASEKGSRCCFTLETALSLPMESRINTHLSAIRTALTHFPGLR